MTYAELKKRAFARLNELREEGEDLHPVVADSRKLASHFWGSAWMKQLALCEAGGMALSPGRSLLRHSCVLDLSVSGGHIDAKVMGEYVYDVTVDIAPLRDEALEELRYACSRRISSLTALLEGKLDEDLLRLLCRAEGGILPSPEEWHMGCTCPDWGEPCPHEAAAVYAVGVLVDADPSLLFQLRGIHPEDLLLTDCIQSEEASFDAESLGAVFGIEIDELPTNVRS